MIAHHPSIPRTHIPGITELPVSTPGMRIGLFGGSFNPPHQGHRLVSRQMLKRLDLDAVWWLVTPGNPLKDQHQLAPLTDRVEAARKIIDHPRVFVTGFEAAHGFRFSYDTVKYLRTRLANRKFVWIMGADNFVAFHQWENWLLIAGLLPLAIYARPGSSRRAPFSKTAMRFADYRLDQSDAVMLPTNKPPSWVYLTGLTSSISSSSIRNTKKSEPTEFANAD